MVCWQTVTHLGCNLALYAVWPRKYVQQDRASCCSYRYEYRTRAPTLFITIQYCIKMAQLHSWLPWRNDACPEPVTHKSHCPFLSHVELLIEVKTEWTQHGIIVLHACRAVAGDIFVSDLKLD